MLHKIHGFRIQGSRIQGLTVIFMIFLSYTLLTTAFATTYKSLTIEEMLEKTEIAFQGKVSEVVVELRVNQDGVEEPWTKVSFEVLTSIKGDLAETHSLHFYGGVSDERAIVVEAMPSFRVNEELIIFAYDAVYYSPIVGFSQGLFRLDEQGWKNEEDKWLGIEEDKLVFVDAAFEDTEAVVTMIEEMLSASSDTQDSEQGGN